MSAVGLIWQASRMPGVAAMRVSAFASSASGAGSASRPLVTSTRQVVQRARPPHTAACGMPCSRSVSSTVAPGSIGTVRPPECVSSGGRLRRSTMRRTPRAANGSSTSARCSDQPIAAMRLVCPIIASVMLLGTCAPAARRTWLPAATKPLSASVGSSSPAIASAPRHCG